jgi:hypothetical protein
VTQAYFRFTNVRGWQIKSFRDPKSPLQKGEVKMELIVRQGDVIFRCGADELKVSAAMAANARFRPAIWIQMAKVRVTGFRRIEGTAEPAPEVKAPLPPPASGPLWNGRDLSEWTLDSLDTPRTSCTGGAMLIDVNDPGMSITPYLRRALSGRPLRLEMTCLVEDVYLETACVGFAIHIGGAGIQSEGNCGFSVGKRVQCVRYTGGQWATRVDSPGQRLQKGAEFKLELVIEGGDVKLISGGQTFSAAGLLPVDATIRPGVWVAGARVRVTTFSLK